jgi:hypothetical protein
MGKRPLFGLLGLCSAGLALAVSAGCNSTSSGSRSTQRQPFTGPGSGGMASGQQQMPQQPGVGNNSQQPGAGNNTQPTGGNGWAMPPRGGDASRTGAMLPSGDPGKPIQQVGDTKSAGGGDVTNALLATQGQSPVQPGLPAQPIRQQSQFADAAPPVQSLPDRPAMTEPTWHSVAPLPGRGTTTDEGQRQTTYPASDKAGATAPDKAGAMSPPAGAQPVPLVSPTETMGTPVPPLGPPPVQPPPAPAQDSPTGYHLK